MSRPPKRLSQREWIEQERAYQAFVKARRHLILLLSMIGDSPQRIAMSLSISEEKVKKALAYEDKKLYRNKKKARRP